MTQVLTNRPAIIEAFGEGKAASLARMAERFPVPEFVVVQLEPGETGPDPAALGPVRSFVEAVGGTVAVRSSASVEDADGASYAGLFDTVLGVGVDDLEDAVHRVARSASNERVLEYQVARGFAASDVKVAIVIQRLVRSDRSGVAFSRTTPEGTEAMIEAVYGLGELLVGGSATPDHYTYERVSRVASVGSVSYQGRRLVHVGNHVELLPVPSHDRNTQKLSLEEVVRIGEVSVDIEATLGFAAADVEWAIDENGALYILQARPYSAGGTER